MPTRKIRDIQVPIRCNHPEHKPPSMQLFAPGVYEHICPACKRELFLLQPKPTLRVSEAAK